MQFQATAVALFSLVAVAMADYNSMSQSVAAIDTAVNNLNDQLWSSSVSTFGGALKVDTSAKNLVKQLNSATSSAQNERVFSVSDSQLLIVQLQYVLPDVQNATQRVAAIQPVFNRMGVAGIAKTDVNQLATATGSFAQALIKICPSATKNRATALANQFNAAMASAVAAYA
ncbi:hypothetical protein V8E36_004186 [Tilletia maclaganii]